MSHTEKNVCDIISHTYVCVCVGRVGWSYVIMSNVLQFCSDKDPPPHPHVPSPHDSLE